MYLATNASQRNKSDFSNEVQSSYHTKYENKDWDRNANIEFQFCDRCYTSISRMKNALFRLSKSDALNKISSLQAYGMKESY